MSEMSNFQVSQTLKYPSADSIRLFSRKKSFQQFLPILVALSSAPSFSQAFSIPATTITYSSNQQCTSTSHPNTFHHPSSQLNARPNVSMLTSESFTDEEDEYEGVWTTPQNDKDRRDQREAEKGKKTRKELIEAMLEEDEKEWRKERKQKAQDRKKEIVAANERENRSKLMCANKLYPFCIPMRSPNS